MSLVRRMFPFARCASTVAGQSAAAAASTSTTAQPAQPEAVPDIGELRTRARRVYKDLYRLGLEYPDAEYNFNTRLRRAFEKNAQVTDPVKLKQQLELAEHIKKELIAMYSLRKYRHLRRAYHRDEPPRSLSDDFAAIDAAAAAAASAANSRS